MKKGGYRPATIEGAVRYLKRVAKNADIMDPEEVKEYTASTSWSGSGDCHSSISSSF
jgi:hypothetical protein